MTHGDTAIVVLRKLVEATRRGLVGWRYDESGDVYETTTGIDAVKIEFLYYLRSDETGSDKSAVEVTFRGTMMLFAAGTDAWNLVIDILMLSNDTLRDWNEKCHRRVHGLNDDLDRDDQHFSFTDCTSFALMRREGIETAFTLDRDFVTAGFEIIPA